MTTHHPEPGTVASYPDSLDQPMDHLDALKVVTDHLGLTGPKTDPIQTFLPAVHDLRRDAVVNAARNLRQFPPPPQRLDSDDDRAFYAAWGLLLDRIDQMGGAA